MTITQRSVGTVTILDLPVVYGSGHGLGELSEIVATLLDQARTRILVNLNQGYVDDAGLEDLVKAYVVVRKRGGAIKLITILENGSVGEVRVTKSLDRVFGLDQKAVEAARQWRFVPGKMKMNGQPVKVLVLLELTFKLK